LPRTIKVSEFKAKCLKLIDDVARTGEPLVITKRGRKVATVSAGADDKPVSPAGMFAGLIDVITPGGELPSAWDARAKSARKERMARLTRDLAPRKPSSR
jgi:prevent-host-death family protein